MIEVEGVVVEAMPNTTFQVDIGNGHTIFCLLYTSIEYDKIDKIRGMDVVICTTAKTDEEAREMLTLVGAPFER